MATLSERVSTWLPILNSHISQEGLEILNLGMRSEIRYDKLEIVQTPSKLYRALQSSRKYSDATEDIILARFTYALEVLGRNRHGIEARERLKECGINPEDLPQFNPYTQSREFGLHQCLCTLCTKLDEEHRLPLIARLAKDVVDVHYRNITSLPQLMMMLLEKDKISPDNVEVLIQGLEDVGANTCADYVQNWLNYSSLDFTCPSGTSSYTSWGSIHPRTVTPKQKTSHQTKLIVVSVIAALLFVISVVTLTAVYGTSHVLNQDYTHVYRSGTAVILTEINHFFTEAVKVTQDTHFPEDSPHIIQLYQVDSKCTDLLSYTHVDMQSGNSLEKINHTIVYLLSDSIITFNICSQANHSKTIKPTMRLQIVIVAEPINFALTDAIIHAIFTDRNNYTTTDWQCMTIQTTINKFGYYGIVFLPPNPDIPTNFHYSMTLYRKVIDLELLKYTQNYTLFKGNDYATFMFDFRLKTSCLVANVIHDSSNMEHNTHARLDFVPQQSTSAGVACGVIMLVLIIVTLLVCSVAQCHRKKSEYNQII